MILEKPVPEGIIFINPPYDERLKNPEINKFYSELGTTLKHKWPGYDVWLFTGNLEAIKYIGLKPSKKITLYNGKIECRLLNFSLYSGSQKKN